MAKIIIIDELLCTGCGLCEGSCPEVFKVENDNLAHVIAQVCTYHDVKQIAADCPVEAITIR